MVHNRWIEVGTWAVHAGHSVVRAVAMVIFRGSGVTYIRRIGHARGASQRSLTRVLQESRRVLDSDKLILCELSGKYLNLGYK